MRILYVGHFRLASRLVNANMPYFSHNWLKYVSTKVSWTHLTIGHCLRYRWFFRAGLNMPTVGGRYVYRRGGNCGGRADLYSRTAGFKMVFAIPVAVDEITICIAAKMALSTPICQTCLRSVKWRVYRARYFFCRMSQPQSLKYIHSWRAVLQCPRVCMSKESISLRDVLIVSPTTFSIYI